MIQHTFFACDLLAFAQQELKLPVLQKNYHCRFVTDKMYGVSLNCANFKVYFLLSTVVNQSQQIGFCLKACTLYIFTSKFCLTILQHINFFNVEPKLIFSLPTKVNWLISLCFCVWKRILCILIHLKILTNYKNTHCMPVFPTCNVLPWNEIKCNFFHNCLSLHHHIEHQYVDR